MAYLCGKAGGPQQIFKEISGDSNIIAYRIYCKTRFSRASNFREFHDQDKIAKLNTRPSKAW